MPLRRPTATRSIVAPCCRQLEGDVGPRLKIRKIEDVQNELVKREESCLAEAAAARAGGPATAMSASTRSSDSGRSSACTTAGTELGSSRRCCSERRVREQRVQRRRADCAARAASALLRTRSSNSPACAGGMTLPASSPRPSVPLQFAASSSTTSTLRSSPLGSPRGTAASGSAFGAAAVDHPQRVAGGKGSQQPDVSGHVERLTVHGDDEIASPDRGGLGTVAPERAGLDADDHYAFRILAQAETRVRGLPRRLRGRRRFRKRRADRGAARSLRLVCRGSVRRARPPGPTRGQRSRAQLATKSRNRRGSSHAVVSRRLVNRTTGDYRLRTCSGFEPPAPGRPTWAVRLKRCAGRRTVRVRNRCETPG